jgi:hypothetical protein
VPSLTPGCVPAKAKGDTWALIATFSEGWSNYRHQADALRQYRALRARDVTRDHIILVGAEDLAGAAENALPATVRNQRGGVNLYMDATDDYPLAGFTADDFVNVLTGKVTEHTRFGVTRGSPMVSGGGVFLGSTCASETSRPPGHPKRVVLLRRSYARSYIRSNAQPFSLCHP